MDYQPLIQSLSLSVHHVTDVLRLDQVHEEISGNKWFKLKYNLETARRRGKTTVLTFGGAFSNHIAATAAACKAYRFNAIGLIRGEASPTNPTLLHAQQNGMRLHFISRSEYALKDDPSFKAGLSARFGDHYLIPEGGNNAEGILGCMEISDPAWDYDYIVCACGTGTTYAGIFAAAKPGQKIIGISVLKGENKLVNEVNTWISTLFPDNSKSISGNEALDQLQIENNCISNAYSLNGYAKFDAGLVEFKKQFEREHNVPLDHVYTVKLFYAVRDLLQKRKFPAGSRILLVHSGGLQGNKGFEDRYGL